MPTFYYVYCKRSAELVKLDYVKGPRHCCGGSHIHLHVGGDAEAIDKVRQLGYPLY